MMSAARQLSRGNLGLGETSMASTVLSAMGKKSGQNATPEPEKTDKPEKAKPEKPKPEVKKPEVKKPENSKPEVKPPPVPPAPSTSGTQNAPKKDLENHRKRHDSQGMFLYDYFRPYFIVSIFVLS